MTETKPPDWQQANLVASEDASTAIAPNAVDLNLETQDLQNKMLRHELDQRQTIAGTQRTVGIALLAVCGVWLLLIPVWVCLSSTGRLPIPEKVLMTLVGSSTATVISLFAIYAKWLFPQNKS